MYLDAVLSQACFKYVFLLREEKGMTYTWMTKTADIDHLYADSSGHYLGEKNSNQPVPKHAKLSLYL